MLKELDTPSNYHGFIGVLMDWGYWSVAFCKEIFIIKISILFLKYYRSLRTVLIWVNLI